MPRPHAEIAEEICNHLWPLKRRGADVQPEVEKRIALLVGFAPMPRVAKVRRQAAKARKELARLRAALAREPLRSFVVACSPTPVIDGQRQQATAEYTLSESDIIEYVNKPEIVGILERKKSVKFPHLDRLDEVLTGLKSPKGPDPRSKPMQRVCMESADALIYEFSQTPATGTAEKPLRAIASLLYEAVTGESGQDLKRAGEAMIQSWRGLDCMDGRGRPRKKPAKG
jgi:hypothetical protein